MTDNDSIMEYIERQLSALCTKDLKTFPVLTLTGPRQSGKSTLLRRLLPDWDYVNLEEPSHLDFATGDPQGFLRTYPGQVVIDEIQRAPRLLSQIQVEVDKERRPGRFAITGSHNLLLLEHVSQSLAGRTSVRHLLPFSYAELSSSKKAPTDLERALLLGGYPLAHADPGAALAWLDSYMQTYVERDVRAIRNVTDLASFRRFLRLCAGRAGQLLDLSGLGGDAGISHNTVRDWVGVLEAGFIAFRLEPYFRNFSKRIIKSPKLFFYDTGLLCRLLDIRAPSDLLTHPFRGAVFENWCTVEVLKAFHNQGRRPSLYFWRDQSMEVDLLIELSGNRLAALECKSGVTSVSDFIAAPLKFAKIADPDTVVPGVVFGGETSQRRSQGSFLSWSEFATGLVHADFGLGSSDPQA